MLCPHCRKHIDNEIIKSEGARLMVASRPDRKKIKDKYAAMRAKVRELTERLAERDGKPRPAPKRSKTTVTK